MLVTCLGCSKGPINWCNGSLPRGLYSGIFVLELSIYERLSNWVLGHSSLSR